MDTDTFASVASAHAPPDGEAARREQRQRDLERLFGPAVAALPFIERRAVELVFYEGLDRDTAAAALRITRETFARCLNGALTRLRSNVLSGSALPRRGFEASEVMEEIAFFQRERDLRLVRSTLTLITGGRSRPKALYPRSGSVGRAFRSGPLTRASKHAKEA